MKLYFLLEDQKSFLKVLPAWLKVCLPKYVQVFSVDDFSNNSYIAESGFGYPSIKNVLVNKLEMFSDSDIRPDCIVVMYDVDDWSENYQATVRAKFDNIFIASGLDVDYKILPIKRCFESWLLGNKEVYPKKADDKFKIYENFYDVSKNDPEIMDCPNEYRDSISIYHYNYLQCMLKTSIGKKYTKGNPSIVGNNNYLAGMNQRIDSTLDMNSFREFMNFLYKLQKS